MHHPKRLYSLVRHRPPLCINYEPQITSFFFTNNLRNPLVALKRLLLRFLRLNSSRFLPLLLRLSWTRPPYGPISPQLASPLVVRENTCSRSPKRRTVTIRYSTAETHYSLSLSLSTQPTYQLMHALARELPKHSHPASAVSAVFCYRILHLCLTRCLSLLSAQQAT